MALGVDRARGASTVCGGRGSGGDNGGEAGPGEPQARPGDRTGVTFASPTQKSGGTTPGTVPPAGQGVAAAGWQGHTWEKAWLLQRGLSFLE